MTIGGGTLQVARLLSARRLRERPLRSALTAGGVAAGVALLFSITLLNAEIFDSVRATGAAVAGPGLLQVSAASPGGLPGGLAADLLGQPGVGVAAPMVTERTTISAGARRAGIFVIGVTTDIAAAAPDAMRGLELRSGDVSARGLIISSSLAARLRVSAGAVLAVETPVRVTRVPVAAVASSALLDRVNGGMAAVMPLHEAQQLFGRSDRVDQIMVSAQRGTSPAVLRSELTRRLGPAATVGPPGDGTDAASADLEGYLLATQLCGLLAVLVAAILVFNTMTMAMAERRAEIALAGSLGATRRQVRFAVIAEAALLGAAGTAVGLVIGGLLARAVLPLAGYAYGAVSPVDAPTSVQLRLWPLVGSAAAGILVAVVGAFVPARRAARAAPIDALRPAASYEWRDPTHPPQTVAVATGGVVLFTLGSVLGLRLAAGDVDTVLSGVTAVAIFGGLAMLLPTGVPLAAGALAAALTRLSPATGRLAGDALRANPRRTSFTVAALGLPLALVVAFAAAFGAATTKFDRYAHTVVAAPLNVEANSAAGYTASQPLAERDQAVLEAVPGVRAVLPGQNAFIGLPDGSQGVLFAIPLRAAERAGVRDILEDHRLSDDPAAFRGGLAAGQIAASQLAARNLRLQIGSRLTLPTPTGSHTFTIAALYEDWSMRSTFYVDRETYVALWGDGGVYRFGIVPTPGAPLTELRERLHGAVRTAGMPAQVRSREEAIGEMLASLTNLINIARGTQLAMLLCAALALANTAFTAIAERRWTLGLQRALGMTTRQLRRSLALEAVAIGLIGSVAGAVIGLGLGAFFTQAMAARASSRLPHPIPWSALAASILLGAGIAALATHYPRRIARRVPIIESLRFE